MPDSDFVRTIRNQFPLDSELDVNNLDKNQSYRIVRELGNGNFGITYMAQESESKDTVALKIEPETYGKASIAVFEQIQLLLGKSQYFPKFRFHGIVVNVKHNGIASRPKIIYQQSLPALQNVPIETLIKLNPNVNPNILKAFLQQIGTQQQTSTVQFSCTVMDFVKGIPLDQKKFPLHISTFYIWQAVKGIAELHLHRIIHADIKPENIMVDLGGKIKILDFTTAYINDTESQKGIAQASSTFSPWAHILGQKPTEYSDIYGLGAVLYYLATGVHPEERTVDSTPFNATIYCRYYEKISSIQRPWRKLLMSIFAENVRLVQLQDVSQPSPNIKYVAQISTEEKEFLELEPITSAQKLIDALAPLIKEHEPKRRKEWNKQYNEQQNKTESETEKRWQQVLASINSPEQVNNFIKEEFQIRQKTELAFREEWDSEIQHRSEIELELDYISNKAEDSARDVEEKNRRLAWEKSLSQWQSDARDKLQEKLIDKWSKSHEQEWNLEIERQTEWDKPRWGLSTQWKNHFGNARQKQQKLPLELEKQEYWIKEVRTFDHKINEYITELEKEQERRRRSIENLVAIRKNEQRRRYILPKSGLLVSDLLEWEKKEQQSINTLPKWHQSQLEIIQNLRGYISLIQDEEKRRIESRSPKDKLADWIMTVGIRLTQIARVSAEKSKFILTILAILAIVSLCGYSIWHSNTLPNLENANNFAIQGDTQLQTGITLEKQGQLEEAKKNYRNSLDEYSQAEKIFEEYFRLYPTQKSKDISIAHYNASVCGWNSYLILNILNDSSLPKPLEQLIFAEKHLKLYNNDYPSKDNEEKLLKYNIYILTLSDPSDYLQSIKSLEEIINRIQSLQLSLAPEDRLALFNLAQKVCANDMPDVQKTRCQTVLDKLK